jgi:hypothetical protein
VIYRAVESVYRAFQECILLWMAKGGNTNKFCPVCRYVSSTTRKTSTYCAFRAPIEKNAIQPIRFGIDVAQQQTRQEDLLAKRRKDLSKYNVLSEETMLVRNLKAIDTGLSCTPQKILDIDVISDKHGSKIMFLVKHLLWLQQEDPGAKAIVFSTWAAGLSSARNALVFHILLTFPYSNCKRVDS